MIKTIAETAWHHEGDFPFMEELVGTICQESVADVVKLHITLDLDEYMNRDHAAYETLKSWMLSAEQWEQLIDTVRQSGKELMLLLNDTKAVDFAALFSPELVEVHSVCMNVPRIHLAILDKIDPGAEVVIGVGGCTLMEVERSLENFQGRKSVLMFGFQNYPTRYEDVNLRKIGRIQALFSQSTYGYADHTGWDEPNNELITLMVAANGMDYVEKHVTTAYGKERCDFSAAVSVDMFNSMAERLKLLDQIRGDGGLGLNAGEKSYSVYGPMKMAGVAMRPMAAGKVLREEDVHFCRTSRNSRMSQLDLIDKVGETLVRDMEIDELFDWDNFS